MLLLLLRRVTRLQRDRHAVLICRLLRVAATAAIAARILGWTTVTKRCSVLLRRWCAILLRRWCVALWRQTVLRLWRVAPL